MTSSANEQGKQCRRGHWPFSRDFRQWCEASRETSHGSDERMVMDGRVHDRAHRLSDQERHRVYEGIERFRRLRYHRLSDRGSCHSDVSERIDVETLGWAHTKLHQNGNPSVLWTKTEKSWCSCSQLTKDISRWSPWNCIRRSQVLKYSECWGSLSDGRPRHRYRRRLWQTNQIHWNNVEKRREKLTLSSESNACSQVWYSWSVRWGVALRIEAHRMSDGKEIIHWWKSIYHIVVPKWN